VVILTPYCNVIATLLEGVKVRKILVTGAAGFIGFHLSKRLAQDKHQVTGLDNLNDYYDVNLKKSRVELLSALPSFEFVRGDLTNRDGLNKIFSTKQFDIVINLAAQAGVRNSIQNPHAYMDSNVVGFLNLLEACRHNPPCHMIFASSSSVYGANKKMPFSVNDQVDHPLSLYAATKKSNELMAHAYATLYNLPVTGLRFFTAYGPYGRPDMAMFIFTKSILEGRPIDVYNFGRMKRGFTHVSDIVTGIVALLEKPPVRNDLWDRKHPDPSTSFAPYRILNIGNTSTVDLLNLISIVEEKLQKKAIKNFLPLQEGDVEEAFADVKELEEIADFHPSIDIGTGVADFIDWYQAYYSSNG
jgi:UDP-glucuronate 4-epimerase